MIAATNPTHETVMQYVRDVLSGEIVSGKLVIQACERFLRDLEKAAAGWDYRMDWEAAADAVEFFPLLKHTTSEYAGKPFELYPFQQFVIANICGWRRVVDGARRFSLVFYSVARGNGKSPLSAGLTVKLMRFDDPVEARALGYCIATKSEQARIIFDECKRFIDTSSFLPNYFRTLRDYVECPDNYSVLRPVASDGATADGYIPHVVTIDELHAFTHSHREIIERIETAFAKRPQALMIITTTAGDENSEIWFEKQKLCEEVLDPNSDVVCDHVFAFICSIDEDDDECELDTLHKANPLLRYGVVKRDGLLKQIEESRSSPGKRLQLRRFHGNRLTVSSAKSITPEMWDKCDDPLPTLDGLDCFAAVDLGWKDDLAAVGYCFPLERWVDGKRCYAIDADVWIPRYTKARDITREPWRQWIADGWLRVTDSEWTDTGAIYERIKERLKTQGIQQVAYDPANATEFALNIVNQVGIERTFPFAQVHAKYNEPFNEMLIALDEGRIIHGGNPLLRWCAMNVVEVQNAQMLRRPDKSRSQDKIDPIVAIIMALQGCMHHEIEGPLDFKAGELAL